jgi:hypothetical protein
LLLNPKAVTIVPKKGEDTKMDAKGFVVPPGGGSILNMAPGLSAVLKLLGGDTGHSARL